MDDLISRQQSIDAFETAVKSGACIEDIKLILAEMPSAQPEIIYCKNCKFYTAYDYTGKLMCKRIGKGMILPKPEDYCSYAERITDGKPD